MWCFLWLRLRVALLNVCSIQFLALTHFKIHLYMMTTTSPSPPQQQHFKPSKLPNCYLSEWTLITACCQFTFFWLQKTKRRPGWLGGNMAAICIQIQEHDFLVEYVWIILARDPKLYSFLWSVHLYCCHFSDQRFKIVLILWYPGIKKLSMKDKPTSLVKFNYSQAIFQEYQHQEYN